MKFLPLKFFFHRKIIITIGEIIFLQVILKVLWDFLKKINPTGNALPKEESISCMNLVQTGSCYRKIRFYIGFQIPLEFKFL